MTTLFHMWDPFRKQLIASHQFYVNQAQKRLLSQFENIEQEADKYADEWLEKAGQYFDPDRHDPGDFYEQAHDESIGFYQMLEDMRNRTRLSVAAGMFHEWDKQLRSWICKEINHWNHGNEVGKAIWKANFSDLIDLLEAFGWSIRSNAYYASLDRCRLVVNAYKHGDGDAFKGLKSNHPEFIETLGNADSFYLEYVDHTALKIEEVHIEEFSKAIIAFWQDVPEYIHEKETLEVPDWFTKASQRDQADDLKKRAVK